MADSGAFHAKVRLFFETPADWLAVIRAWATTVRSTSGYTRGAARKTDLGMASRRAGLSFPRSTETTLTLFADVSRSVMTRGDRRRAIGPFSIEMCYRSAY